MCSDRKSLVPEFLARQIPDPQHTAPAPAMQRPIGRQPSPKLYMRPPRVRLSVSAYGPTLSQRSPDSSHLGRLGISSLWPTPEATHYPSSLEQAFNRTSSPHGSDLQVRSPLSYSQSPCTVTDPCESLTLNIRGLPQNPDFRDPELPDENIQRQSLGLYFTHIHPWYPILHKQTILDKFEYRNGDEEDCIVLHAIVASTMRFFPDGTVNKNKFRESSKKRILLYGLCHSSVTVLQALVILALDIVGLENGPEAWHILAVITRSVVLLNLNVESSLVPDRKSISTMRGVILPQPVSWIENECRRRLFWMVYLLDRYTHIATAFDFILDETEIARTLPCDDVHFVQTTDKKTRSITKFFLIWQSVEDLHDVKNLGPFSFYIEAVHMLSLFHVFLKKPVDVSIHTQAADWWSEYTRLNEYLQKWRDTVPVEYGLRTHISAMRNLASQDDYARIMLHAAYHT